MVQSVLDSSADILGWVEPIRIASCFCVSPAAVRTDRSCAKRSADVLTFGVLAKVLMSVGSPWPRVEVLRAGRGRGATGLGPQP